MPGNQNFSRTISYKGQFDVSDIIKGLQQVRQQLGASTKNQSLFIDVDKELKKVNDLSKQIQAAIQKGFSNPQDLKNFEKITSQLETSLNRASSSLQGIDLSIVTQEAKDLKAEFDKQKEALNAIVNAQKLLIGEQLKGVTGAKKYTTQIIDAAKDGKELKDVQKQITSELEKQVNAQKEKANLAQQNVDKAKSNLEAERKNAGLSLGRGSFADTATVTDKGKMSNISAEQMILVQQEYAKILSKMKSSDEAEAAMKKLEKALGNLGIKIRNPVKLTEEFARSFKRLSENVKPAEKDLSSAEKALNKANTALANAQSNQAATTAILESQELAESYRKVAQQKENAAKAGNAYDIASNQTGRYTTELQRQIQLMQQRFNNIKANTQATREATQAQQQYDNTFENLKRYIQYTFSLTNGFRVLRRAISQTLTDIKNLDKSFADIAMVTDYSVSQMWESYKQYAQMANELGQSTQDVIKASGLFYQQGLDTAESLALTTETMKLATLAGIDFEEATSQMTAAIRGFNLEMDEGQRVTDVYSELAAKAAADVEGIAYAMSKTASIANSAGMSFENTAAFLTQMIETTQEAPENIGTAMKTIIARFTELKENVAGTEDSEFDDLDYNKVDKALKSVGVSLKDSTGQFRNLDEVFLELAKKWNTLDRNTQRYIATIAAGSRQQSRFIAMMENYERTIELTETAYNSAGKASEQFAKYQDTVEYKTKQLANSWEQLRTSFLDSSTYKEVLDFLNELMNRLKDMDMSQFIAIGLIGLTVGKTLITNFVQSIQIGLNQARTGISTAISKTMSVAVERAKNNISNPFATKAIQRTGANLTTEELKINSQLLTIYNQQATLLAQKTRRMQELDSLGDRRNADEQRELELLRQQTAELRTQKKETASKMMGNGLTPGQINQANKEMGDTPTIISQPASQIGSVAVSSAITTALMAALSGSDFEEAIKIGLTSGLIAALPVVLNQLLPIIGKAITTKVIPVVVGAIGTAGVIVVGAIVAAIGVALYAANEVKKANLAAEKAELNRLKRVKELNEKLTKEQLESMKKILDLRKQQDKLESSIATYEELSQKAFLTKEEQDNLDQVINTITSDYSDIVLNYNKNTNELILNTYALKELKETLAEQEQKEEKEFLGAGSLRVQNLVNADETAKRLGEEWAASLEGYQIVGEEDAKVVIPQDAEGMVYTDYEVIKETPSRRFYQVRNTQTGEIQQTAEEKLFNTDDLRRQLLRAFEENDIEANLYELNPEEDLKNAETFAEYLNEAGLSVQDFSNALKDFTDKAVTDEQILSEARFVAALEYQNMEIDGLKISEEMAKSLSYSISMEDILKSSDIKLEWEDALAADGGADAKDILRDTFQEVQEAIEEGMSLSDVNTDGLINMGGIWDDLNENQREIIFNTMKQWEKDEKKLMDGSDGNLAAFESLPEEFTEFLNSTYGEDAYDADSWENVRKNAERSAEIVEEFWIYQFAKNTEGLGELTEEQLSADKNMLVKIQNILENASNLTEAAFLEQISKYAENLAPEVRDSFLSGQGLKWDETLGVVKDENNPVVGTTTNKYDVAKAKFSEMDISGYEDLSLMTQETIISKLQESSLSAGSISAMGQELVDIYSSLTAEQAGILSSVDILNSSYLDLMMNGDQYIKALEEAGMSHARAAETYENYVAMAMGHINKGIAGKDAAEIFRNTIDEQIKGFNEKYATLFEAQNEFVENGELSTETYYKMIEDGFEEYVDITASGYTFLADKAQEMYAKQALIGVEAIDQQIKTNEKLIASAEELNNLTGKKWTGEWTMIGSTSVEVFEEVSIDSIIQEYQKLSEEEKKTTDLFADLTTENIDLIISIAEAGYQSIDEYIKALKEGNAELSNMKPDVWIQGLINLQEASIEAQEKVNDLKDELADLEEQLIEEQEAIDEAAQALHEAKFGTEDFQSGLDGLINYERPLGLINKQLENLKENLTDVSNVEDASAAMNQIAGLYEDKMATLQAEGKVIDQSLANIRQELLANYSNYISFDENGLAKVDFSYEDMQDSDVIKTDGLEKLIEEYNSTYDMALDKEQEYLDAQKEFDELKSEARDKYIAMEQNVIDIIKEQMQEEIDAVTDKYAALEEADNNYLDALQEAIDKQRKLRDQENQYEDLATKEKKLALMQRDTSGANRKEVISLEQEIEDDRQNLLDNEIDNLIDSMKELYDKQKEARDLEIEAMEAATENMQLINETALNIISGFTNVEDYQSWLLENNPSVKDMTVAQTEQYLEEAKENFAGYAQYVSLTTEEIKLKTDKINQKADEMFTNTSENITDIGTVIQDAAEKAKQEAIDDAQEAYDKAVEKMDETQKKITETKDALDKAEDAAVIAHGAAMDEMVKASESAILKVATAGAEMMIEAEALDLSNSEDVQEFAKTHNFYNEKTGEYSRGFVDALTNKGYDTSSMVVDKQWQITGTPINGGPTIYLSGTFDTKAEAEAVLPEYLNEYSNSLKNVIVTPVIGSEVTGAYKKYAEGGLVNYTGPAWVDGTPQKPESFLSAEDTARIGAAAKLLADLPIFNTTSNAENAVSTNIGDTSIEIHINVENISDDYDVDQMIERVKQDIVDVAKPIGTSVILNK